MGQHRNVRTTGDRVDAILAELTASPDPRAATSAEELVRLLVELYGEGLRQVMTIAGGADPALPERLATDPLLASLLLVHDLHPVDTETRVQRALDEVRPYLGSHAGGVRYRGIDEAGVVQLELEGSCHGCPSSTVTVRLAIEQAVRDAAPETIGVEVAGVVPEPTGSPLLRIGRRPPEGPSSGPVVEAVPESDGWIQVRARPEALVRVIGAPVVLCRVRADLYAYRDDCPECGALLSNGSLSGAELRCADCARTYDVRRAGIGLSDPTRHLEPLPLLLEGDGIRIATGVGVPT